MRQPFRLLVTGSRGWDDIPAIEHALAVILARHPEGVLLVHGACPRGADAIAAAYAFRTPGYHTEAYPADRRRYGRAAGRRRNAEMITLSADGCVAFLRRPRTDVRLTDPGVRHVARKTGTDRHLGRTYGQAWDIASCRRRACAMWPTG